MNKLLIKGQEYKLAGDIINKGMILDFKAVNRENQDVRLADIKGIKVISVFPDINTRVCDMQTLKIAQLSQQAKHINFISISMDAVEVINTWCVAKGQNVDIWSDLKYKEFASKTNALIPALNKLARGFIVLNEQNEIIDIDFVKELSEMPNFELLNKYL